jgi:hypothetical protein
MMNREEASFRDHSGFIFYEGSKVFRTVSRSYKANYDHLINSGLYEELVKNGLMVAHDEMDGHDFLLREDIYKVISPEKVPFISYSGEWCFSQIKEAALVTLKVQQTALKYGMFLKDASSYNIQFWGSKAIFIDTLSFEIHVAGHPWVAYRQFCEHFLCPLLLISKVDDQFHKLLATSLDGIPLSLTAKLLPIRQKINPSILMHVVLHAQAQKKYQSNKIATTNSLFTKEYLIHLSKGLEKLIGKLEWKSPTLWGTYYEDDVEKGYLKEKKQAVAKWINSEKPQNVWDLGANDGTFSKLASTLNIPVLSLDIDLGAVEKNYLEAKLESSSNILPLVFNFANPTPSYGWALKERKSLFERGKADMILALGLVHHMVITEGVPLDQISAFLSRICNVLIIEFIPKSDPKVIRLLQNREDVFIDYEEKAFLEIFSRNFRLKDSIHFENGERSLYKFTSRT